MVVIISKKINELVTKYHENKLSHAFLLVTNDINKCNKDIVEFYENLEFVERMTILVIYFEFNYNYREKNMLIRSTFAEEEEYAKPFIKALTL